MKVLLKEKYDSSFHSVLNRWNYNALIAAVTSFDADAADALACLAPDANSIDTVDEYRKAAIVGSLFNKLPRQGVPGQLTLNIPQGVLIVSASAEMDAIRAMPNALVTGFYVISPAGEGISFFGIEDNDDVNLTDVTVSANNVLVITYVADEPLPDDFPACDCNQYVVNCNNVVSVSPPLD